MPATSSTPDLEKMRITLLQNLENRSDLKTNWRSSATTGLLRQLLQVPQDFIGIEIKSGVVVFHFYTLLLLRGFFEAGVLEVPGIFLKYIN